MNFAKKMTKKVNKINEKVNTVNDKIIPNNPVKVPTIKSPSRKSQKIGAMITGVAGVSILAGSVLLASKVGAAIGVVSLLGASVSYWDSKSNQFKDKE